MAIKSWTSRLSVEKKERERCKCEFMKIIQQLSAEQLARWRQKSITSMM